MTGASVTVEGEALARARLTRLEAGLEDMTVANRAAAGQLLAAAEPRTPHRTGRLLESGRVEANALEGVVEYAVIYAGVVHNGWPARNIRAQPWLAQTADLDTGPITGIYVDYIEGLIA